MENSGKGEKAELGPKIGVRPFAKSLLSQAFWSTRAAMPRVRGAEYNSRHATRRSCYGEAHPQTTAVVFQSVVALEFLCDPRIGM